jgi:hypothetical protein
MSSSHYIDMIPLPLRNLSSGGTLVIWSGNSYCGFTDLSTRFSVMSYHTLSALTVASASRVVACCYLRQTRRCVAIVMFARAAYVWISETRISGVHHAVSESN